MDQFVAVAAAILAERAAMSADDPEPQIAATALLGLWRIQFQSLSKYLDGTRTPAQVHQAVTADVRRAARLIDTGLNSFAAFMPDDRLSEQPGRRNERRARIAVVRRSDQVPGGQGRAARTARCSDTSVSSSSGRASVRPARTMDRTSSTVAPARARYASEGTDGHSG